MKRIFRVLLTSIALLSLASCVDSNGNSSSGNGLSSSSLSQEVYYHVTFVNYDESTLYEVDVLEGSEAVYGGETPIRAETDEFTYEFIGWDQDLLQISADVTTIAQYNPVPKEQGWGPIIK